jgi:hypothetical protein
VGTERDQGPDRQPQEVLDDEEREGTRADPAQNREEAAFASATLDTGAPRI